MLIIDDNQENLIYALRNNINIIVGKQDDAYLIGMQRLNELNGQISLIHLVQDHIDDVLSDNIVNENENSMKLSKGIKESGASLLKRIQLEMKSAFEGVGRDVGRSGCVLNKMKLNVENIRTQRQRAT
jgi:hypothetical protein